MLKVQRVGEDGQSNWHAQMTLAQNAALITRLIVLRRLGKRMAAYRTRANLRPVREG